MMDETCGDAMREVEERQIPIGASAPMRQPFESAKAPVADLGGKFLADIIEAGTIQALIADFYLLARIPVAIVDLSGKMLVSVGLQEVCRCFHRKHPQTLKHCMESDLALSAGVPPGEYKLYKCKNHLWDVATPIMVGDQHVANLFTGQFFFENEPLDYDLFRAQARQYGFDEQAYLAALEKTPRLNPQTFDAAMGVYTRLASILSKLGLSNVQLAHSLSERDSLLNSLRESEEQFRTIFELASVGMAQADPHTGRWVRVNQKLCDITGYAVSELIGMRFLDITHPDDREYDWESLQRVVRGEAPDYRNEKRYIRKDGALVWVNVNVAMLRDDAGNPLRTVASIEDITERKRTEQALRDSEARFRSYVEHAPLGVFVVDRQGRYVDFNPAALEMLGYDAATLASMSIPDLVWHEDRDLAMGQFADLLQGNQIESEHRLIKADGSPLWIALRAVKIADDRFMAFCHDIAERRRAEETLAANCQLAGVNAALAEADRRKDEFLAMLAHELRNPLAPIRNAVHLLRQNGADPAVLLRQHDIIERQVAHMARLLDDLLDVSRITHGKIEMRMRPLALADVLAQAIETADPLIQGRRHRLEYAPPSATLSVEGDFDRLAQALGNLLANAAKYTEMGGRIWLEAAGEGGEVVIRVRDTGIGIAPEMLPRIFELFTQADRSLDRAQGGLGIGLTMARALVQLHGGTIEARSAGPRRGSEFTIRLPALSGDRLAGDAQQQQSTDASPEPVMRRILVVDDVADTAESMVELLESWGHAAHAIFDGHSALAAVREFRPDVVLLDIGLPGMDGYTVARQLRAEHGAKLLMVALTGYGQENDQRQALAVGFDHHMVKPVDLGALRKLLGNNQG